MDYDLHRLSTREFEHLTQSLAVASLGAAVRPFGDGPDGGREATFEGAVNYPVPTPDTGTWHGYGVLQAKFRQRPQGAHRDAQWFRNEIQKEINHWKEQEKNRRTAGRLPQYLLFATNVYLSSVPGVGGSDSINDLLERELAGLGMKGWDVWDGEKIRTLLDHHEGIRTRYYPFIGTGDLLVRLDKYLGLHDDSLRAIYETHTLKSLRRDQWIRLDEAGGDPTTRIPLSQVAIDLPVFEKLPELTSENAEQRPPRVLAHTIALGDRLLRPSLDIPDLANVLILGGPGQGKSTISQLLCQAYRLALLEDYPHSKIDVAERNLISRLTEHLFETLGVPRPSNRRWPFAIKLSEFGDAVAGGENVSLLRFIATKMSTLTGDPSDVTPSGLRSWLGKWPWLLVLDGLDEVPTLSVREKVFDAIRDFQVDARSVDADLFIVATTRIQGYSDEFNPETYQHLTLAPLPPQRG